MTELLDAADWPELLEQAIVRHRAFDFEQAEQLYRAVLAQQPGHADALHNLGVLYAIQLGRPQDALAHFEAALNADAARPQFWFSYVDALIRAGQHELAGQVLPLARASGLPASLANGLAQRVEQASAAPAAAPIPSAPALAPAVQATTAPAAAASPAVHAAPAPAPTPSPAAGPAAAPATAASPATPRTSTTAPVAAASLTQADQQALVALFRAGEYVEGERRTRALLAQHPDEGFLWKALGTMLQPQDRKPEALAAKIRAAELLPGDVEALCNLGRAHFEMGDSAAAATALQQAVALAPDHAEAHNNLGLALNALGRVADSHASFERAVALKPDFAEALNNLSGVYTAQGHIDQAAEVLRRAVAARPDYRVAFDNLLFVLNYHPEDTAEQIRAVYADYERVFGQPQRAAWRPHDNDRRLQRRLRVGYVSPDFRLHACTFFMEPLLQGHDHHAFEVFAYAEMRDAPDAVTQRYQAHVDHWVPTRAMGDAALAERIRQDGIDILVDLAGHTKGNRLGVFARKPAPVSLSWMGFGCTTGLEAIDWYLTDAASAPVGSEHLFSEGVWRLPGSPYTAYRPATGMGEPGPLPVLRTGHVTLGTLTRGVRVNRHTVRVWAELLRRLPGARLAIDSRSYKDEAMADALVQRFVALGIARERLLIGCHSPPWDVLRGIDIGLDCFPHNSGTTLFESLYMGVPFVTLAGRPSVGRIGSAILQGLGRPEWIAQSEAEYIDKVVALASDLPALAQLRAGLRAEMQASALMDEPRFVRAVEQAYRDMFAGWAETADGALAPANFAGADASAAAAVSTQAVAATAATQATPNTQATQAVAPGQIDAELQRLQAELHYEQANTLHDQGRLPEAEAQLRQALALCPGHAEAHNNLGLVLQEQQRAAEAQACYRTAIALQPDDALAHHNLGNVLQHEGQLEAAVACYQRAQSLGLQSRHLHDNLLFLLNYHPTLSAEQIYANYQDYERVFGAPLRAQWTPHRNAHRTGRRLKVGYVSPDFRQHACTFFLEPLLAGHDKTQVEVYAYAELKTEDDATRRYQGYVDHWVPTAGMSDLALAARIRADAIDILVELAGHTRGNRLGVFARKPAPVSLSWMGYGTTTGLAAIDWYLTDAASVPPGHEHVFSEVPWRLPDVPYAVYRPADGMGDCGPLPALAQGAVTLGTLSRSIRLNDRTLHVWAQILARLPQARLAIDSRNFADPHACDALRVRFAALGVPAERLAIGCHSPPWDVLRGIDIGLDCFPHNSGTTLFESLYMGVPFVTLAGRPSVGRIGSAILQGLGRPEWIAQTEAEYIDKVVALASDLPALAQLRAGLRTEMQASALMDEPRFVRAVEAAYRQMFARWAQAPKSRPAAPTAHSKHSATRPSAIASLPTTAAAPAPAAQPTPQEMETLAALFRARRFAEGATLARALTERCPHSGFAFKALGVMLQPQGLGAEALAAKQRAAELLPDDAEAQCNFGMLLQDQGRLAQAETVLQRALAIKPDSVEAHNNLAITYQKQGRLDASIAHFEQALALQPAHEDIHSNLLFTLNYHPDLSAAQIFAHYRRYEQRFCLPLRGQWQPHTNARVAPGQGRRLRVGYVSPDFRRHACCRFLEPLLASHDKAVVEVFAYAELAREDDATQRYRALVDHWVPTRGLDDAAVAERVRADGIDILVDLAGHTVGNRLGVFARKPAPVSLSWLGYGYTTGVSAIDYFLTDAASAPAGCEPLFAESPWRLPAGWSFRPAPGMGDPGPLPALARGHLMLGTLTRSVRINHHTLRVWSRILQQLPGAHLVVDSGSFVDPAAQDALAARFEALGIERHRLHIGYHSPPWDVLRTVDIGLDCFPHNSGTTLFESLYMGVPFVTLAGRPSVGRLGSSILQGAGHPEWVAETEDAYVEKVVTLAADLPALARLRADLRGQLQASVLMDETGFARQVEQAYQAMFAQWSAGNADPLQALVQRAQDLFDEGNRLHDAGDDDTAEACWRRVLAWVPEFAEAHGNLGLLLQQRGQMDEAEACYREAVALQPDAPTAHYNLGVCLKSRGQLPQAEAALRAALALQPDFQSALAHLDRTLQEQGRAIEAEPYWRAALRARPDFVAGYQHLAAVLRQQHRPADALACLRKAEELEPDSTSVQQALADVYRDLGQLDQAEACSRRALAQAPDSAQAWNNLAQVHNAMQQLVAAEQGFRRAIALQPDLARAHGNLGIVLQNQGRLAEAEQSMRRALALQPEDRNAHGNLLFVLNYHPDKSGADVFAEYRAYDQRFYAPLRSEWRSHGNARRRVGAGLRRLKVGYVSPDFRNHSVANFLEPLLAHHDRTVVQVHAYAELQREDSATERYKRLVDHWVPTRGMTDAALAERIRADGIDILVDLAGHTGGNRLGVFGRKPAPVSLSWMGYGYTTGLAAIDYFLTDAASAPEGSEAVFSEQPWRLPCGWVYRPAGAAQMGEPGPLPALGTGGVTFGTLTRAIRVNEQTVRVWAALLRLVPGSRLVIDSRSYRDTATQDDLAARFVALGIARERLLIGCHSPAWDVLRGIDIGLDCFPHNSGTTLFETLYMGIPFVSLASRPSVGRLGSSILCGLGRPEWIAQTEDAYIDKAAALAADLPRLATLRAGLRGEMQQSLLMDEAAFAREVEAAYGQMFERWEQQHEETKT
jgi:predicted O-linked N-acetylglucosamine transferase (SPINDLY family)